MSPLPFLLFVHCFFIFIFRRWLGPLATFITSLGVYTSLIIIICIEILRNEWVGCYNFLDFGRWFYCLDLFDSHLLFCFDLLGLLCAALVLVLTNLAIYFGAEYMFREAFINRLLYLLNLFATSVVTLFFAYDLFVIVVAWECIGLFSFLLVNFYSMRVYTLKAALKTFVFGRLSDMFMFIFFCVTLFVFNTTDLSIIFLMAPFFSLHFVLIGGMAIHLLSCLTLCVVLSGLIKAAQFFFHVWLPDAMEAPTPASALIHSSTLVVAGIFLIIRLGLLFEFALIINYGVALLGAVTLVFGAITATFQYDIKKLVAYSTIILIGYLACGCGFCCYEEVLIYLIIHAINKAFLFILVGYVVHFFAANTDMRQMGGVYLYALDVTILLYFAAINLTGLPYSAGFIAKEMLLFQMFTDTFLTYFIRACWLISFIFTPIYMFMLPWLNVFGTKRSSLNVYQLVWTNWISVYYERRPLLSTLSLVRFQWTAVNSRLTAVILSFFWIFINYGGELWIYILGDVIATTGPLNSPLLVMIDARPLLTTALIDTSLTALLTAVIGTSVGMAGFLFTGIGSTSLYELHRRTQIIYLIVLSAGVLFFFGLFK